MAIPGGAGTAVSFAGGNELMNKVDRDTPPNALREQSRSKLEAMRVSTDVIDLYIRNRVFTPREQNDIIEALSGMPKTMNCVDFIKFAVLTENPDIVYFRWRQADMYLNYHRMVSPLTRFVPFGMTAAAITIDGTLVFNAPLDYLRWTSQTSEFTINLTELARKTPGVQTKHLLIEGSVSPLARKNLEQLGWKVSVGANQR